MRASGCNQLLQSAKSCSSHNDGQCSKCVVNLCWSLALTLVPNNRICVLGLVFVLKSADLGLDFKHKSL